MLTAGESYEERREWCKQSIESSRAMIKQFNKALEWHTDLEAQYQEIIALERENIRERLKDLKDAGRFCRVHNLDWGQKYIPPVTPDGVIKARAQQINIKQLLEDLGDGR